MRAVACLLLSCLLTAGCAARADKTEPSGFLTDYGALVEAEGEPGVRRFESPGALGRYSAFLIDPIAIQPAPGAKLDKVPRERLEELVGVLETALRDQLSERYSIVLAPAPGALRIRAAVTDVDPATPLLNIHPATKISGLGLGGAAIEAEGVDSVTGERVFAVLVSRDAAKRIGSGLGEWEDARQVMRDWAEAFRERVDAAHEAARPGETTPGAE